MRRLIKTRYLEIVKMSAINHMSRIKQMAEKRLSQEDFDAAIRLTRMSESSIEVARAVLVEGQRQVTVVETSGVTPARVSSIVNKVWDVAQTHLLPAAQISMIEADYAVAVSRARLHSGDDIRIARPENTAKYVGEIIDRTRFHVVQNLGKSVLIHNLAKLDRAPAVNEHVVAQYDDKGNGVVVLSRTKVRGGHSR